MPSSEVMHKWKSGKLHSGSKTGPKVKSQKQAIAIMLSEKRAEDANGGKYPEKRAMGGPIMGPGVAGPMGPMGATPGGMMPQAPMPMNANAMQQPPSPMNGMQAPMGVAGGQAMPTTPRQLAVGGVAMPGVGGFNMAKEAHMNAASPMMRSEERNVMHGPVLSAVSGRTDAHKTAVPSGSYVIPADIVSGRGQGNTLAGMNVLQRMFKMGPYGTGAGGIKPGRSMPGAMKAPGMQSIVMARGGGKQRGTVGTPTPVHLAGGELVIPPNKVLETVQRLTGRPHSLKQAHEVLDKWVVKERKELRAKLAKLPGPVKD